MSVGLDASALRHIMPHAGLRAETFLSPLSKVMSDRAIHTPARAAAFLAQIAVESGDLRWTREIWGPTQWQVRYEGRKDLGNTVPGDGHKFMGRGLIMTTGRNNYRAVSRARFGDERLLDDPTWLETIEGACWSAGYYWGTRRSAGMSLNAMADEDTDAMFREITIAINGAATAKAPSHHDLRRAAWARAKEVLYPQGT